MAIGVMQQGYTVWCGNCGDWKQSDGSGIVCARFFRKIGWENTKKYGWLCPLCKSLDKFSQSRNTQSVLGEKNENENV